MPWQYCIVNASGKSSPTLSITTNDRSVSFVEQASAKVQVGNYPAQVFQSSEPLLMQALPTYQFSLNQTPKHQDPVCLVNALPLPGARQVHQSASGYVSSVNVYI